MSKDRVVTTLPDREDMMERLKSVDSSAHVVAKLHRLIIECAGEELTGIAVVNRLQEAIAVYSEELPSMTQFLVEMDIEAYVTALIDDDQVRGDALAFMAEVRKAM